MTSSLIVNPHGATLGLSNRPYQHAFLAAALAPVLFDHGAIGEINFNAAATTAVFGTAYALATLYTANRRKMSGVAIAHNDVNLSAQGDFVNLFGGQGGLVNATTAIVAASGPHWVEYPTGYLAMGEDYLPGLLDQPVDKTLPFCSSDCDIAREAVDIAKYRKLAKELGVPSVAGTASITPPTLNGSASQSGTSSAIPTIPINIVLDTGAILEDVASTFCNNNKPIQTIPEQANTCPVDSLEVHFTNRNTAVVINNNNNNIGPSVKQSRPIKDSFVSRLVPLVLGFLFVIIGFLYHLFLWIQSVCLPLINQEGRTKWDSAYTELQQALVFPSTTQNGSKRTKRRRANRKRALVSPRTLCLILGLVIPALVITVMPVN